jgi:hypothetical protein
VEEAGEERTPVRSGGNGGMHPTPAGPVDGTYAAVERAIAGVPGVLKASVVASDTTGAGRLRLRVAPGEDRDAVSWAVATTLRERFGIPLDPAAIRPAPEQEEDPVPDETRPMDAAADPLAALEQAVAGRLQVSAPTATGDATRAAIGDLATQQGRAAVAVTATLEHRGRTATAAVDALATSRARWRAVAQATLTALGELTDGQLRAEVVRVTIETADAPATVTVVVTLVTERGEEHLAGAALLRDDPEGAVMRATLAAVNRRIEPWLRDAAALGVAPATP